MPEKSKECKTDGRYCVALKCQKHRTDQAQTGLIIDRGHRQITNPPVPEQSQPMEADVGPTEIAPEVQVKLL